MPFVSPYNLHTQHAISESIVSSKAAHQAGSAAPIANSLRDNFVSINQPTDEFLNFTRRSLLLWLLLVMSSLSAWAQSRQVSGRVTSFAGSETLPGVAVRIKGTSAGTVTDLDGKYQIQVSSDDAVLQFSFVGYNTEETTVGNRSVIDVFLAEDIETLGEVVVVGYGVQQKREVTGAITKVEGASIACIPTPSFEAALQGQAAGVQVIQGSGLAGSGSVIKVRGTSAISASGDPLYVVDGVQITQDYFMGSNRGAMNQNPLASLNPENIESVEILKDAGAAAIYGSRGANGVIIITTKRGKAGKGKLNFSTEHGFSQPTIRPKFLNTAEYIQLRQEAWENDGNTGPVWLPNRSTAASSTEERAQAIEEALRRRYPSY